MRIRWRDARPGRHPQTDRARRIGDKIVAIVEHQTPHSGILTPLPDKAHQAFITGRCQVDPELFDNGRTQIGRIRRRRPVDCQEAQRAAAQRPEKRIESNRIALLNDPACPVQPTMDKIAVAGVYSHDRAKFNKMSGVCWSNCNIVGNRHCHQSSQIADLATAAAGRDTQWQEKQQSSE